MRILLVDDDDLFVEFVRWIVQKDGELSRSVEVDRVHDGEDALIYFFGPDAGVAEARWPDLILLDQRMPRVDGTDVLKRLRNDEATRHLVVGMLSSSNQARLVEEAYAAGANFYFVKPLDLEELQVKLRKIVDFVCNVVELPPA